MIIQVLPGTFWQAWVNFLGDMFFFVKSGSLDLRICFSWRSDSIRYRKYAKIEKIRKVANTFSRHCTFCQYLPMDYHATWHCLSHRTLTIPYWPQVKLSHSPLALYAACHSDHFSLMYCTLTLYRIVMLLLCSPLAHCPLVGRDVFGRHPSLSFSPPSLPVNLYLSLCLCVTVPELLVPWCGVVLTTCHIDPFLLLSVINLEFLQTHWPAFCV